jgi:glucose-1-phosphate adenylyltransferase
VVDRSIIDKEVVIGAGAHVGDGDDNTPNRTMPEQINTGISLVGKGSVVPEGYSLGRNVVVHAHTGEEAYGKRKKVASGHDIGAARR